MNILLNPLENGIKNTLRDFYQEALKSGEEIFIVSAYLTNWDNVYTLNKKCKEFCFIVGTDFGITRKEACKKVLNWLPKNLKNDFCAADFTTGFHPKMIIWRTKKDYYTIIGSSNLTQAAFDSNYEVNVFSKIEKNEYNKLKEWILNIKSSSTPISEDWLKKYREINRSKRGKQKSRVINLKLPSGRKIDKSILERRKQKKKFLEIEQQLKTLIKNCASKKISNKLFFSKLWEIWGNHESRIQGQGFQILGKHGNWREICNSLLKILKGSGLPLGSLDNLVRNEIDFLAKEKNPNRKAWLSEMLCHYFPDNYPLVNGPVETWLHFNKFRSPTNSSEGSRYIDLSIKLRQAIKENTVNKASDMTELDAAVWQWHQNKFKK
jgi:HKD family nuclease